MEMCRKCVDCKGEHKSIEQFRMISLLSVEYKAFFKIVANCLIEFLLKNSYIDTSMQKGGVPGILNTQVQLPN